MLELHFANMMEDVIGEKGLSIRQIEGLRERVQQAHVQIQERKWSELCFLDLVTQDVTEIKEMAARIRQESEYFLLLGIGGSAMGPRAIVEALKPFHNYLDHPKIFIYDNVDPRTLHALLAAVDLTKTTINVVTKSGNTAETIASFMIMWKEMEKAVGKKDTASRFVLSTSPDKGIMHSLAREYAIRTLPIPSNIVGRYSVLSSAGLLISEIAGIDSSELLRGAGDIVKKCAVCEVWENPAVLFASLLYLMGVEEKRTINVMMPYADGLKALSEWFCQLWAESMGKLGFGLTPYPSVGTTDQHSQLQLWMDGPEDKVVIFIHIDDYGVDIEVPAIFPALEGSTCLAGHTLNEVIKAAQDATELVLSDASKPNMAIKIPRIDAYHVGQLLHFIEISTVVIGFLFGVNPFNQPWVEIGKNNIFGMLGKQGFQKERDKIQRMKEENRCWRL